MTVTTNSSHFSMLPWTKSLKVVIHTFVTCVMSKDTTVSFIAANHWFMWPPPLIWKTYCQSLASHWNKANTHSCMAVKVLWNQTREFFWTQTETSSWSCLYQQTSFFWHIVSKIELLIPVMCSIRCREFGKTGVHALLILCMYLIGMRQNSLSLNETQLIHDAIQTASAGPVGHSQSWLRQCRAPTANGRQSLSF